MTSADSDQQKKIIVTGATGFIGSRLVANAISRRIRFLPVVRSDEKASKLGFKEYALFQNLTAQEIAARGFDHSIIVHLIGSSRDDKENPLKESIVRTTREVVSLGKQIESSRIIYLSGYGITEDSTEPYFQLKAEAENIIENSGIPYTLFRPSYVLGPGDEITPFLIEELQKGHIEIPGDGSYRFQPVYVGDMVDIITNAVGVRDNQSFSYDVLGQPISFLTYVKMVAARIAPNATIRNEKVETFIREATLSSDPTFTTSEIAILICDLVGPVTEICLGVKVRSLEATLDIWIRQTDP